MNKNLILLLALLFLNPLFSQEKNENSIITREDNSHWNIKFQNENLEGKIQLLRKRFMNDQNIYFTLPNPHAKTPKKEGYDEITFNRPIYIFKADDVEPIMITGNPSKEKIEEINSILLPENILHIDYKDNIEAQTIHGSRATNGVITIKFSNKNYLKDI